MCWIFVNQVTYVCEKAYITICNLQVWENQPSPYIYEILNTLCFSCGIKKLATNMYVYCINSIIIYWYSYHLMILIIQAIIVPDFEIVFSSCNITDWDGWSGMAGGGKYTAESGIKQPFGHKQ